MAYPMAPNGSNDWNDWNAMHKVRGLSADERYARKVAARWALVAVSAEKDAARALFLSGHVTEDEFAARWNVADDKKRKLLGAAERGEFPAPVGFTLMTDTTPEMYAAARAQAGEWEAGQTERRAA